MNTQKTLLALCAIILSLTGSVYAQGSLTPPGAPAPTMRTLDQLEPRTLISSLPFEITQPGSYVVVRNLSGSAGGITVSASNVTVDLNGFTLSGDSFVFGHAMIVVPSDKVKVMNGVIQQWGGDGVHAPGVTDLQLHNVRVLRCAGDGVEAGSVTLRDVTVEDNGGAGVRAGSGLSAGKVSVHDISFMKAARNGGGGVSFVGPCDASVCDSHVLDNTGHGVAWASSAADEQARVRLERCDVSGNTGRGLHISEASAVRVVCSARDCTFLSNGSDGVAVLLTHLDAGLKLDLQDGSASGNGGSGMNIQEGQCGDNQNTIIRMDFSFNDGYGSTKMDVAAAPSLFSQVTARSNGLGGLAVEGGAWTLERCAVTDNGSVGISAVMRTGGGHVTLIKFADCDVARNGGTGVSIAPDAAGGPYKVAMQDMHVHDNSAGGISYVGTCDASVQDASVSGNAGNGLAWASSAGGGGTGGTPALAPRLRLQLRSLRSFSNLVSGLHISETGDVDVDCDFDACAFDRNGLYGATIQVPNANARLDLMMRGGGACDNFGHGLDIAAGLSANQGFFDVALSRNGGSGIDKIDAGASPGTMERVVAQNNGLHGFDLTGGTWSIGRCTVSDNTGNGVVYASKHVRLKHVSLLKVYDCTVERNGGDGLYVHTVEDDASYKVSMQDMHFRSNTGNGVHLSCNSGLCSVELDALDCSASGNAGCGVKLIAPVAMDKGLRFRKKGGDCDDNALGGIFVDDSVVVRSGVLIGCVLRDNGTTSSQAPGFRAPGGALRLERCVASGNSGDGFLITRPQLSGSLDQSSLSFDGCDAVHNGLSGIVVAGFDATTRASVSVTGGKAYWNVALGIDLSSSTGARGRVHGVHLGDNGAHGLLSAAASLDVCDNQFTGNVGSGLHVLSGAHRVARNVCSDNAVGVFLTAAGCTVLQNTFSGSGSGGALQVPIEDASGGGCDIAPFESASGRISPVANQSF